MDLIQNILDFLLSPVVISFIFLFLVTAAVTAVPVSARKRMRRFKKEYKESLAGKQVIPVSYFSQEDIAGRKLNARLAKPGFMVFGTAGEAAFYILTGKDKYFCCNFTENGIPLVYLDNDKCGNMLPSMIRFHEDGRSHYMYCVNWLGSLDIKKTRWLFEQLNHKLMSTHVSLAERRTANPALLAAFFLVVALTGATVWLSWDDSLKYAPIALTKTGGGEVVAASSRILYLFDYEGALKERIELKELGINDGISDIQALGSHLLLIGDSGAGVIKRCNLTERECETLNGPDDELLFLRAFQFHYDEQRARIYVADSSRHRLLELSEDGSLIRELANNELLCFPNTPVVVDNRLYLANTNHHEIIVWDFDDGFNKPSGRWLTVDKGRSDVKCPAVVETPGLKFFARERARPSGERALPFESGRRGRVWPFSLAYNDDGSWWLINGGDGLQYGDILKFSGDPISGRPVRAVLPDEADPVALLPRSDDILIAETDGPSIIRTGLDGSDLGVFGGVEFTTEMNQLTERRKRRFLYQIIGIYLTAGFVFVAFGILVLFRHFRIQDIIAQDPAFKTSGA